MIKRIPLFTLLFCLFTLLKAQVVQPCITDELYYDFLRSHPEVRFEEDKANNKARDQKDLQKAGTIRYIPVVFHVIHKYGFENISQAQINDAIRVLNEDFRKKDGTNGGVSTDSRATDMEIEFRLAQLDPLGNPTNGVNRVYSTKTTDARDDAKTVSYWDSNKYFNIWVTSSINNFGNPGTVLGYAQFPWQRSSNPSTDGILVRADQIGFIEYANNSQRGRTVTHEAGHWVGLYHPFQGGCAGTSPTTCASQGDQVCDTPPVADATNGCPTSRNSCTETPTDLPDNIPNYMDYADGNCMNMYTTGQKVRSSSMVNSYRTNIFTTSNLSAVGIDADGNYKTLAPSTIKAPYKFGFDIPSIPGSGWQFENYMAPGDSGWTHNKSANFAGGSSISARNLLNTRLNVRNAFSSPSIDISNITNPVLTFYVAYAKKSSVSNDKLNIFVSNSFGRSEILAKSFLAADLETAPMSSSEFVPSGASQWKKMTIDLSAYAGYTNMRLRFELQSLRGNNIYVDEISIDNTTGFDEDIKSDLGFEMFPNPFNQSSTVTLNLKNNQDVSILVRDLIGRELYTINNNQLSAGKHEFKLNKENFSLGIYLLEVNTTKGMFTHKFIID